MSNCPHIYELQAHADGQCTDVERQRLSDHAAHCARCAEALRELECARLPLHLLTEEPPADLPARLLKAVEDIRPLAPLSCEQALEWVSLRLDGELPHDRMERLEAHLMACSACYRAAAEMQCAAEVLRETAPATAPAALLPRLQAAAELAAPPRRRRSHTLLPRFAMSFAAAAAAIVLAIALRAPVPVSQVPVVATAPDHPALAPAARAIEAPRMAEVPATGVATAPNSVHPMHLSPGERALQPVPASPAPPTVASHATAPPAPRVEAVAPSSPPLPAAPSAIEIEHPRPAAVALAGLEPAPPVRQPEPVRDVPAPPAPATLAALPRVAAPAPARVAPEAPKPAPAEATVAARPEPPAHRTRSHWVSRPASNDRDIYSSESGVSTRLADARSRLAQDARDVHNLRSPGYVIIR